MTGGTLSRDAPFGAGEKCAAQIAVALRETSRHAPLNWLYRIAGWPATLRQWLGVVWVGRRQARRLRLCESLALGERRFVAVIEFEQLRFLIGGTSSSLSLLARLEDSRNGRLENDRPGEPA